MTAISNERLLELADRAQKGARFFDARVPGWWAPDRIDLDTLDQEDACRCVFAQLYGGFFDPEMVARVFSRPSFEAAEAVARAHGLVIGYDDMGRTEWDYARLTEFWRAEILARRHDASLPTVPQNPTNSVPGGRDTTVEQ